MRIPREIAANTENDGVFILTQRRRDAELFTASASRGLCVRPQIQSVSEFSATLLEGWRNVKVSERGEPRTRGRIATPHGISDFSKITRFSPRSGSQRMPTMS